jgi:hypothetical protein
MNYDYQSQDDYMIGAIKIKDGLFIGDELAIKVKHKNKNLKNLAIKQNLLNYLLISLFLHPPM